MDPRVENVLEPIRSRSDNRAIVAAVLAIRSDQGCMTALVDELLNDCTPRAGWLLPPVCGWLESDLLRSAAISARRHLAVHESCDFAGELLEHDALRHPSYSTSPVLHVAYPEATIREWWDLYPFRTEQRDCCTVR